MIASHSKSQRPSFKFAFALATLIFGSALIAEEVEFSYTLEDNHGIDFSEIKNGPLSIAKFTDERDVADPNVVIAGDLGDISGGISATTPLAAIVEDALRQGFVIGGAELSDSNDGLVLHGQLTVAEANITDRRGVESIRMTIRAKVQLRNGSRELWQNTIFGRDYAPVSEGIEAALSNALNKLVDSLVNDDYFLIQML
ncbi:MAG: hypothetical protein DHS20C12_27750 [Pseudohongiella sp.]|nr:MAG: hypothetical protein DHS20C12_27750 [Pseudohongiella sp.]